MARVLLPGLRCDVCGHKWCPKTWANGYAGDAPLPRRCTNPACRSMLWDMATEKPATLRKGR